MDLIEILKDRGLVAQVTHEPELKEHLGTAKRTVYAGFDPTAPSLHVGHLMPIMGLRRFQQAGHRVIAIAGGGTALVGDPTGKTELRNMLTQDQITSNLVGITKQLGVFLKLDDPKDGLVLNNVDWLGSLSYLEFLRDIGPHFSVNRMLTAECFRQRMEKGLSFLEFNYMLLQSYDFLHLYRSQQCTLQIGGDDQWSNILSGMELIRRLGAENSGVAQAFCLTMPLLTTSDGRKMGKTEKGAVWLDPTLTSPYEYFQYWRNVEDAKVGECLAYFTDLPMDEVRALGAYTGSAINQAKLKLAYETTKLLHGETAAQEAQQSAQRLFAGVPADDAASGPEATLPKQAVIDGLDILDLLRLTGLAPSRAEARRLVTQGGVTINKAVISDPAFRLAVADFSGSQGALLRKGKKAFLWVKLTD